MGKGKRILFSVLSLIGGYISLDYLYYAYRLLAGAESRIETYRIGIDGAKQLAGLGMFLVWFVILAAYGWLIRKASVQIDLLEQDDRTGEPRIRRKWFDLIMQGGMIVTGAVLRWCYLVLVWFPGQH